MSDIPCIYEMSLVNEKDTLKQDIINGKALDILLSLLSSTKNTKDLSKELNIPSFSVQLYINRLLAAGLIQVSNVKVLDDKVEKTYELASSDIEILNYLKDNCGVDNIDLSAQHFSSITREMVKKINDYHDKPHKIKAYFIKANQSKMEEFKQELNELFEKYQSYEDLDSKDTYGFISAFAPYNLTKK